MVIQSLQHEGEILKAQNADRAQESHEISEQIQNVRSEINHRDSEIRELCLHI
jgi:hypothetical protein